MARAQTTDPIAKECILKAAEALPKVAGLIVKKSATRVMPSPANWPGSSPPIVVDVAFTAAGQSDTYSFLCATSANGTFVQRLAK